MYRLAHLGDLVQGEGRGEEVEERGGEAPDRNSLGGGMQRLKRIRV